MLTFGERAITMRHNMRPGRLVKEKFTFFALFIYHQNKTSFIENNARGHNMSTQFQF